MTEVLQGEVTLHQEVCHDSSVHMILRTWEFLGWTRVQIDRPVPLRDTGNAILDSLKLYLGPIEHIRFATVYQIFHFRGRICTVLIDIILEAIKRQLHR